MRPLDVLDCRGADARVLRGTRIVGQVREKMLADSQLDAALLLESRSYFHLQSLVRLQQVAADPPGVQVESAVDVLAERIAILLRGVARKWLAFGRLLSTSRFG